MIPQMLAELPPRTEIVLANALYFKGRWQTPFKSEETTPGPFRIGDGRTVTLPRMQRKDRAFSYRETDRYQAVRLPFKNGAFDLVLVLPREGVSARTLGQEAWTGRGGRNFSTTKAIANAPAT